MEEIFKFYRNWVNGVYEEHAMFVHDHGMYRPTQDTEQNYPYEIALKRAIAKSYLPNDTIDGCTSMEEAQNKIVEVALEQLHR